MRRWLFLFVILLLSGCTEEIEGTPNLQKAKLGVFTQLDTRFTLYDEALRTVHFWEFDEPYTGMAALSKQRLLVYGFGVPDARIYDMSTGRQLAKLRVEEGVVAVHESDDYVFIANSQTDIVSVYDSTYKLHTKLSTGNYPMSMSTYEGQLYVVNYQDEHLSVIDMQTMEIRHQWPIPQASQGILVTDRHIYIGGHGSGSKVNMTTTVLDRNTGETLQRIATPLMPIDFVEHDNTIYTLSHGSNTLYQLQNQHVVDKLEVAANPFALGMREDVLYIAGYDDDTLYEVKGMSVRKTTQIGDGPLQIFTEEAWQ